MHKTLKFYKIVIRDLFRNLIINNFRSKNNDWKRRITKIAR